MRKISISPPKFLKIATLIWGALMFGMPALVQAQCTMTISNNGNRTYTIATANQVVCVTATTLGQDIIIDAPNCTINFGGSTYTGNLTVTTNGTGCIINNMSGSNISSSQNNINAATTINNNSGATWSGNFYNGQSRITAPLTIVNAGTWGSGNQLEAGANLTFTNSGDVTNVAFYGKAGLTSQVFALSNSGTWTGQVVTNFAGNLSIANSSGSSWAPSMSLGTLTGFTVNNQGTWGPALGTFSVSSPGTATITNAGTWAAVGFGVLTGTTAITNTGNWNNTQVSVTGALTINQNGGTWSGVPNVSTGTVVINNTATWGVGLNFPAAGPNSFNNSTTGTATFPNAQNLGFNGPTTFQNSGTLTINKASFVLSAGSSINNLAGTMNLNTGVDNKGSISNQAKLNVTAYQTTTNTGTLSNTHDGVVNVSSSFSNSGTVSNSGVVATTGNFTNSGTINGPAAPLRGSFTVTGASVNSGFFGGNTSANRLDLCDASSSTGGRFDTPGGTIGTSTVYCSLYPLPVELTRFAASAANGRVTLSWATASEKNSAYFAIERSANGREFVSIAEVKSQGNSSTPTDYRATDEKPLPGQSYYRLRQVDADGTAAYSPVAVVTQQAGPAGFSLSPNPAADQVLVDLTAWPSQPGTAEVLSLSGQLLLTKPLVSGSVYSLDVRALPAGTYLLRVRTAGQQTVRRLLKL